MTCVVGLIHEGTVWIGGDSAGVSSQTTFRGKTKKVFRQGPYVIGFAGSYNLAQTILGLSLPKPPLVEDLSPFMEITFSAFLKDQVYHTEEEASLLVGVHGQLFEIDAHFGVFEGELPFNAIGGAAEFAMGALLMSKRFEFMLPREALVAALGVAHELSPGNCQPPYTILQTEAA